MHRRFVTIAFTLIGPACLCAGLLASSGRIGASPTTSTTRRNDQPIDFTRQIRPILSQHCFACHGPDAASRKAGLALTTFEDATADRGPDLPAISPGEPAPSAIWQRINDPLDPMPPAKAHNPLSPEQIELIGRWIEQGASYAPHWAYVPPVRAAVPEVSDADWPHDAIDNFILARLEAESLTPVADADPTTLLRRLYFDLTGLPPTTHALDAFLADASPAAFAREVDHLLASPHFGERMAITWLDLVRYADTVGYHGDQTHRIWPYRDWVIEAFNRNVPFDQFTVEQLAGDLLPNPTQEQLIASGYNRLLQTSHEGGVQLKEYRAIYQADRIRNVSGAWMGATIGCAQCHDHKYDPYTARDFYALGAFFADIDDEEHLRNPYDGLNTLPSARVPEMRVHNQDSRAALDAIAAKLVAAEQERQGVIDSLAALQEQWEADLRARLDTEPLAEFIWVDDALDTGGRTQGEWRFTTIEGVPPHSGELYRVQASDALVQHYSADTTEKTITVREGDVFFCWVHLMPDNPPSAVMVQFNAGGSDWEHRAFWGADAIPYGKRPQSWPGYRRMDDLPPTGEWVELRIPAETVGLKPGQVVSGIAFTQFGGSVLWDDVGVRRSLAPPEVIQALRTRPEQRDDAQRSRLYAFHLETSNEVQACDARIAALKRERDAVINALPLTMYTRALDEPRTVRILPRGNWLDETGDVVQPAVPAFLGSIETDGRASRLDLAHWLTTPIAAGGVGELTARVFVNRIWAMFFGEGLCPSLDDFGGQGVPPNHPELLDMLALDFIDSGWDVKALVKRLVRSRAYQLSSIPSRELAERDPQNHLFGRQARHRLPAEMVRDTALAISGLLEPEMGGPPIKPPQPAGYYRHLNFPERTYRPDTGAAQYRRSVYMHWQRQYLHPVLGVMDAPTREECTAKRPVSNTPLAALALLNEPVFVHAAVTFAERSLNDPALTDDELRIAAMMRNATGRTPTDAEIAVLMSLLQINRPVGEEHAWTQVARAILNLHEVVTRE